MNTFFNKMEEHLITYKSGQRSSTIDYILTRGPNLKSVKYCKVIRGESIAAQHRILVMEYRIRQNKRRKPRTRERQIRWWKIRNREGKDAYTAALFDKLERKDVHLYWKDIETILIYQLQKKSSEKRREKEHIMKLNPGGGMMKYSVQ